MEGLFYQSFGFEKSNVDGISTFDKYTIIISYAVLLKKNYGKVAIDENVCLEIIYLVTF